MSTDKPLVQTPTASADTGVEKKAVILIVDDDKDLCNVTADLLRGAGYDPVVAYGPEEAKRKIKAKRPDLVLLDIQLDGANGFDLMKDLIFTIQLTAPIILITGV